MASQSNQGETLQRSLAGHITFHAAENLDAYGMSEITSFNICCEARRYIVSLLNKPTTGISLCFTVLCPKSRKKGLTI